MSWTRLKVGDITHVVTKGTTPTKNQGFVEQGVNFIKAEALNGDSALDPKGFFHISDEVHQNLKRSILEENDVLLTIAGAKIGKCGIVRSYHLPANTNQAVGIMRIDRKKADPRYLYYWFKQRHTFAFVQGLNAQAAQPNINLSMLKNIQVPVPLMAEQQAIASILSAYDDLIENNRRRVQLLEQAARLLYKEWFVHLRFPGHEHVKIIDGVPEGWERTTVPEVIEVNPMEATPRGTPIRYVPMAGLSTTGMSVELSVSEMRAKSTPVRFRNGDTLFARITPCLENGKTGFVNFLHGDEVACGSTEFIVLRGKSVSSFFTYCLARTYDFRETAIKSMIGSSGRQRVQISCFNDVVVALPPRMLLEQFDKRCEPIFRQIGGLSGQVQSLTQARNLLLPRLMNGEITV